MRLLGGMDAHNVVCISVKGESLLDPIVLMDIAVFGIEHRAVSWLRCQGTHTRLARTHCDLRVHAGRVSTVFRAEPEGAEVLQSNVRSCQSRQRTGKSKGLSSQTFGNAVMT